MQLVLFKSFFHVFGYVIQEQKWITTALAFQYRLSLVIKTDGWKVAVVLTGGLQKLWLNQTAYSVMTGSMLSERPKESIRRLPFSV